MSLEELLEVFTCDSHVNVVVYLNGNTYSVALTDTEAAIENNIILKVMLCNCFLEHFSNILRSLEEAGRAHTYLYDQHITLL